VYHIGTEPHLARDVDKAKGVKVKAKAKNAKVNFSSKCQS